MKKLLMTTALVGCLASPAFAAHLNSILLADGATRGSGSVPCDSQHHTVATAVINGDVVKAYIFISTPPNPTNPTNVGGDGIIYGALSVAGGPAALVDVHKLQVVPSDSFQGDNERTFEPDSVFVTTVTLDLICNGGGVGIAYGEVWWRAPALAILPPSPLTSTRP